MPPDDFQGMMLVRSFLPTHRRSTSNSKEDFQSNLDSDPSAVWQVKRILDQEFLGTLVRRKICPENRIDQEGQDAEFVSRDSNMMINP